MVGVDRLDYTKGIPQKLLAYDKFLTDNPQWVGKVVLIQLAIPTRSDVEEYVKHRQEVEQLIGTINGKHGRSTRSVWQACCLLRSFKEPSLTHQYTTCTRQ